MRRLLLLLLASIASPVAHAQQWHPRVVIVSYFEVGEDTGDAPNELQFWVERDRLTQRVAVPGMTRPVRVSADGREMAVAVGPGNIKPGVNLMALGSDPRFDLRDAHWLLNGIAGISPANGTVGSALWTDYIVNGDLAKEIDPREMLAGWPDGFLSLDGVTQSDPKAGAGWEDDVRRWPVEGAHSNRRGNVIRMNPAEIRRAFALTKDITLPEDKAMRTLRERYIGFAGAAHGPVTTRGEHRHRDLLARRAHGCVGRIAGSGLRPMVLGFWAPRP